MSAPYCMYPECHQAHTAYYVDGYSNSSSAVSRVPDCVQMSFGPLSGSLRLCKVHAIMRFKVALG